MSLPHDGNKGYMQSALQGTPSGRGLHRDRYLLQVPLLLEQDTGISHVGIYAGNGKFIHAPNSRSTVSYSDLTSGYWADHYYGARRMA